MNDIDRFRRQILESETFCFYPFLELSTNPAGHIKPCCLFTNTLEVDGKTASILNGNKLEDVWNGDSIREVRKKLFTEQVEENCKVCRRDDTASMRVRSINEYKNNINILRLVKDTVDNDYTANYLPKRLELKPSNLCNLKCVMCNSYDSSQVAKELVELSEKYNGIDIYNGRFIKINNHSVVNETGFRFQDVEQAEWSDIPEVWESFKKIIPGIETLSFAGGEPTIMPFVLRALEYCVDNDYAKNITVYISSNFTNLNKNFLNLMPNFKKFELIASIDGIDKIQEYTRFPSKWSQISNNYLLAKQYMEYPNVKILINITVSILNVINLDSLLYWIEERANEYPYYSEWPFNINLLYGPYDQQIIHLSDMNKELCRTRLLTYLEKSKILKEFPGLDSKIHLVLNQLESQRDDQAITEFKNRIAVLDEHRKIDIRDYIPELDLL
jgi:organic radical activating enzyme